MTADEEQRIAIHEARGYVWITSPADYSEWMSDLTTQEAHDNLVKNHRFQSGKHAELIDTFWIGIPDYLSDLNAMHEAEKVLIETNSNPSSNPKDHPPLYYYSVLMEIVSEKTGNFSPFDYFKLLHATAAQRAEAFCRVKFDIK